MKLPSHLSWEEVLFQGLLSLHKYTILTCRQSATLAGVGTTAWNSFDGLKDLPKDATALLQGTGGVSVMALLICLAAGIRPIITSSSNEKLSKLMQIAPGISGVNYKSTPDISVEISRLTHGKGVDYVLNNVGLSSIPTDLQILRGYGGSIALIGFLGGLEANWHSSVLMTLIVKAAKVKLVFDESLRVIALAD